MWGRGMLVHLLNMGIPHVAGGCMFRKELDDVKVYLSDAVTVAHIFDGIIGCDGVKDELKSMEIMVGFARVITGGARLEHTLFTIVNWKTAFEESLCGSETCIVYF